MARRTSRSRLDAYEVAAHGACGEALVALPHVWLLGIWSGLWGELLDDAGLLRCFEIPRAAPQCLRQCVWCIGFFDKL